MAFLLSLLIGMIGVVDTTLLMVDRDHPSDNVMYPTPDDSLLYGVLEIHAASLKPFCLSLERASKPFWSECYRAGGVQRAVTWTPQPGHPGEALVLVLQSPVKNDTEKLSVLVQMVVSESPITRVDGGVP